MIKINLELDGFDVLCCIIIVCIPLLLGAIFLYDVIKVGYSERPPVVVEGDYDE